MSATVRPILWRGSGLRRILAPGFGLVLAALLVPGSHPIGAAAPPTVIVGHARATKDWRRLVPAMTPTARALERDGYALLAAGLLVKAAFFAVLLTRRRAWRLQDRVAEWLPSRVRGLRAPVCLLVYLVMYHAVLLPVGYAGYRVRHHYGIAVQSLGPWAADVARGWAVDTVITVLVALALLWVIRRWPRTWWLAGTAAAALFSAFLVYLSPLLIDPLFHHFTPLRDPHLRAAILDLARKAHVHVNGVYVGQFSSTTTEGNAYVTGLGSSQRIVLWDTILKRFPPDELQAIVSHELGHYALHHIVRGLAMGVVGSLLVFFLMARMLDRGVGIGWIRDRGEAASVVPLAALALVLNLLGLPVINAASRVMEAQADAFSLQLTGRPDWFIAAMRRLSQQDYDDPWPNPILESVFYSHPSISERIHAAVRYGEQHSG